MGNPVSPSAKMLIDELRAIGLIVKPVPRGWQVVADDSVYRMRTFEALRDWAEGFFAGIGWVGDAR